MTVAERLTSIRRSLLLRLIHSLPDRRLRILAWHAMAATGIQTISFERDGLIWNIRLEDDINWRLYTEGGFQAPEIRAVLDWMRRSQVFAGSRNVFIDAGANIGTTCLPVVRATGCRALAIEPVQDNFSLLQRNVQSNQLSDRIYLARKALAYSPGTLRMCLLPNATGGHFIEPSGRLEPPPELPVAGYEDVDADTFLAIVAAAGLREEEIAFVWSDVQGSELAVIECGAALWHNGVPLWAEVEPLLLRLQGTLPRFATTAAVYFDRFIDARDLLRLGEKALPRPIQELAGVMEAIKPPRNHTDILLLPPAFAPPLN